MMSRNARFAWTALLSFAGGLLPATSQAGLFDCFGPQPNLCSYTTYRPAYRPGSLLATPMVATTPGCCTTTAMSPGAGCGPCASYNPCGTCSPCTAGYPVQTAQYAPRASHYAAYTAYSPVPYTACRAVMATDPCCGTAVATYRPFLWWLRPRAAAYTTYQPVCATGCAPACNPCATSACSPCASGVMPTSAVIDAGATVTPSLPAGSCPSCSPAPQIQTQRLPVFESAPATSAPANTAPLWPNATGTTGAAETSVLRPESTGAPAGTPYSAPAPGPSATFAPPGGTSGNTTYQQYNGAPAYSAPTSGAALPGTSTGLPPSGLPMGSPYSSRVPASPSATPLPQQPIRPMNGTNWPIPSTEPSPQDRLTARPVESGRVQLISASIPAPAVPPQPTYVDHGGWHAAQ